MSFDLRVVTDAFIHSTMSEAELDAIVDKINTAITPDKITTKDVVDFYTRFWIPPKFIADRILFDIRQVRACTYILLGARMSGLFP